MLTTLKRAINLAIYGGSRSLNDIEKRFLFLALNVLPPGDQAILQTQIAKVERIKRYNNDRMVTFQFDNAKDVPLFADKSPEVCLVSFALGKGSKSTKKALGILMIHRGRLSSLEIRLPPRQFSSADLESMTAKYRDEAPPNIAQEIDSEEHG